MSQRWTVCSGTTETDEGITIEYLENEIILNRSLEVMIEGALW
jgi:hypothetical protein